MTPPRSALIPSKRSCALEVGSDTRQEDGVAASSDGHHRERWKVDEERTRSRPSHSSGAPERRTAHLWEEHRKANPKLECTLMPSSSTRWMYATKPDLETFSKELENRIDVTVVSMAECEPNDRPPDWPRLKEVPELGLNASSQMLGGMSVLILPRGVEVPLCTSSWRGRGPTRRQMIKADAGRVLDQAIIFRLPGANLKAKALLPGELLVDGSLGSSRLLKAIVEARKAVFSRRGLVTIGGDALSLVEAKWRLATDLEAGTREDFSRRDVLAARAGKG